MTGTESLPDVEEFIGRIRREFVPWFLPDRPVLVVRAPARLDVMGGIADYTGSLVLETPLRQAVVMGIQPRDDQQVVMRTAPSQATVSGNPSECRWPLAWLYEAEGHLTSPDRFACRLEGLRTDWAKYPAGVFYMLLEAGAVPHFGGGVTLVFASTATPRVGIGSSGALEVATCQALTGLYGVRLDPLASARICQRAENHIVGAPCGIMDQVTSLIGPPNALLQLRCQPHEVLGTLPMPEGITVVGIGSGMKHSVGGLRYVQTRVAAFMGHRIILERMHRDGAVTDSTNGYLANVQPEEYVDRFRDDLPVKMRGEDFLRRYGQTADPATRVDPRTVYKVRSRTL